MRNNMAKEKKSESAHDDLEQKCQEYLEGWKRAKADYENLQRDMAKAATESRARIKAGFAHDLLPVMDNFAQAVAHAPTELPADAQNWLQGVTFIQKQFEEVLTGLGLERIETKDQQFDPNLHEAVETRSEEGAADQTILEEVATGWKINDSIIRPAKVIINNKE